MRRYNVKRGQAPRGDHLVAIRTKADSEYAARLSSFREALGSLRLTEGTSALLADRNAEREGTSTTRHKSIATKPVAGPSAKLIAAKAAVRKAKGSYQPAGSRSAAAKASPRKPAVKTSAKKR